nr:hypothetical protein 1 - rat [Rattus norvegicus]
MVAVIPLFSTPEVLDRFESYLCVWVLLCLDTRVLEKQQILDTPEHMGILEPNLRGDRWYGV